MAANPLTIEDLIARAVDAGEIVQGVNDPETLKDLEKADGSIAEGRTYTNDQVRSLLDRWATK
jgi:hypothetical protein